MKALRRAASLCIVVLSVTPFQSLAAQTTTNTNVTAVVHDYDTAGTQLLTRSDDVNGSGQATYVTVSSRSAGTLVSSVISNGEWQLTTSSQSGRAIYITPNDPIDSSQPAAPPAGYYSQVEVRSHCFDQNGNVVPLGNVVTSSGSCQFGLTFTSGGTQYKLLMSPFPFTVGGSTPPTCPSTGCPNTGWATITCNVVSGTQCVNWTITPNTTAANANVANLYQYVSSKRSASWVFVGQYHNTFRVDVTNP